MSTAIDPKQLQAIIEDAWEKRDTINTATEGPVRTAVQEALAGLDEGAMRVAEKSGPNGAKGDWTVNQWLKKAVLLSFRLTDMGPIPGAPGSATWFDKVPSKFDNWGENRFRAAGFRAVPGAIVRHSAYIAPNVVLMPSFVNLGAHVGSGTMVDTWATVGSCAQIGKNCHLSGGVGIGGVLEPLQATPVIIEDDVFVGARSEVAEGVVVEEGAVLAMGCFVAQSTKIYSVPEGRELPPGRIPARGVCVPGSLVSRDGSHHTYAIILKKHRDARTDARTALTSILREGAP